MEVKRTEGVALVTSLLILVVVALMAVGGFLVTQMELNIARNDAGSLQAHYVAQAGVQKYKTNLFQYFRWLEQLPPDENPERTACFDRMGSGMDLDRDGSEEYSWSGSSITFGEEDVLDADGNLVGTYRVTIQRDPTNRRIFTVQSRGTSRGARATVRSTLLVENTGVLENAIFTGRGQANKHINGGTTIRGGIYVVGDDLNPDNTVVDTNGNFSMLNDYDLTGTDYAVFESRVSESNRTADNLCASLRVDKGRVELSGSVKLGDPDNWLLGAYIGDEPEDLIVNDDSILQCEDNKGVCAEIGRFTLDISQGSAPEFPTLDGPASQDSGCTESTWRACIRAEAEGNGLAVSFDGASPTFVYPAKSELDNSCTTALSQERLVLNDTAIDCTYIGANGMKQGFEYSPSTSPATLDVYGTVNLRGFDLEIAQATEYTARTYGNGQSTTNTKWNGSFAIEANGGYGGDIDLFGDLLTDSVTTGQYYPDHVLGLVAENDVFQSADSVMAPIYAGGTFRIISDSKLLGSVVSDYFCTTGAGGTTGKEKKKNSKESTDKCNAGQNSEVIFVNTGHNKPEIMRYVENAGIPIFKVMSYERR